MRSAPMSTARLQLKISSRPNRLIGGTNQRQSSAGTTGTDVWYPVTSPVSALEVRDYDFAPSCSVRRRSFAANHHANAGNATAVAANSGTAVNRSKTSAAIATPSVWPR
jgi:hypothetical protein